MEQGKNYGQTVDKFDACRAALARRVEQDTGKLPHPPDNNIQEWHEWLIEQSDSSLGDVEARAVKLEADLARCKTAQALAKLDTLAATPAEVLERASGFEQLARDAVSDLGRYARDDGPERRMVSVQLYEKALDKLDALGKEGP